MIRTEFALTRAVLVELEDGTQLEEVKANQVSSDNIWN